MPQPDALLSQCLTFRALSLDAAGLVTELQTPGSVLDHCVRRSPDAVSEAVRFATDSKNVPSEQAGAFIQAATEAVERNRQGGQPQAQ